MYWGVITWQETVCNHRHGMAGSVGSGCRRRTSQRRYLLLL